MSSPTLLAQQQALGGVTLDRTGDAPRVYQFCLPGVLHFGDARGEYLAATSGAGLFDVSDRRQIEVAGKDGRAFLHSFCTNDVKRLKVGHGCEALVANVKGRIVAHIFVCATQSSMWIEAGPGDEASLVAHFERYVINQDVQLIAHTAHYGELLLSGPGSGEVLARVCTGIPSLEPLQHVMATHAGRQLAVRRIDLLGTHGVLLSIDRTALVDLWTDLLSAGARPCGAEAFHAARIEAGFPLCGLDLSEDNLAQEAARTQQAISFTKGCYLGQEPISRIDSVGHINRQLCRLRTDVDIVPESGAVVTTAAGEQAGVVTSAARIPGEARSVALACLRTSHCQPETQLNLQVAAGSIPARVW